MWLTQWRYRRRLKWCQNHNVLHYALAETGEPMDVMKWPKKKLLWMRDIDAYLARDESRLMKRVGVEVREQIKQAKTK